MATADALWAACDGPGFEHLAPPWSRVACAGQLVSRWDDDGAVPPRYVVECDAAG